MPQLLSQSEFENIAARMTAEYGLPPPIIIDEDRYSSGSFSVTVQIMRYKRVRVFPRFKKPTKNILTQVRNFYAENFEDALVKLKDELAKFDKRAGIAEAFREKYTMQEATEELDKILST